MSPAIALPLAFGGVIAVVFLVLILLGRARGVVRLVSLAAGTAVVVLGAATAAVWLTGGAPI